MNDPMELDLRALDDALRASAQAAGWKEEDLDQQGILPEHIQEHPLGPLTNFELDRLPEGLRYIGWATWKLTEDEVILTAEEPDAEPVWLGTWPRSVWGEFLRRSFEYNPPPSPPES